MTDQPLRLAIAADHAGFELKEYLKTALKERGYLLADLGTDSPAAVDYTDFALAVAAGVGEGRFDLGIMICGTGIGSQVAANKLPRVRAGVCHDCFSARASRSHNDLNVLCLGARVIGPGLALEVTLAWLGTDFSGEERHLRRLAKIRQVEERWGERSAPPTSPEE